jgi:4-hydroxybenzoate polyprenyltransferase
MEIIKEQNLFKNILKQLQLYGSLVRFSHTIFALPFALSMFFIVMRDYPVSLSQFLWILLALVSARTVAMAFNRYLDRKIDALNARTAQRELPKGLLKEYQVLVLLFVMLITFFSAAAALGLHCLILAPLVIFILCFYSYTKRFTSFAHIVLGLALALAPGGVWYALTAKFAWEPLVLMFGVLFWVAGFDVLYSCQDRDFDQKHRLYSLPVKLGISKAFRLAQIFHFLSLVFFLANGSVFDLSLPYYIGLALFSFCLLSQYFLIKPDDLAKIDQAFFSRNAQASLVFFLGVLLDYLYF